MPVSSPSYSSASGNGGVDIVGDACQYVVVVSSARLGGGAWVYQLQQPIDLQDPNIQPNLVNIGSSFNESVQVDLPTPSGNTVTISLSQP